MSVETSFKHPGFREKLQDYCQYPLKSDDVQILQINVGRRCNLSCRHCHLEAGPLRTEMMAEPVFQACLELAQKKDSITTIDITGGAPEMNTNLAWFLPAIARLNKRILVRTNLVILLEEAYKDYLDLFVRSQVELVGSLPHHHPDPADRQRGKGNFLKAITVIRSLNEKGYAQPGSVLILNLMHNPAGAFLPATQTALEQEYRSHLQKEYAIRFNHLLSLANMPLGRYLDYLIQTDNYEDYMGDLVRGFNAANINRVMCKTTLSVGYDGQLYDCDFNQSLGLTVLDPAVRHVATCNPAKIGNREIAIGDHCYGCTAGGGSSCQGCFE
jgi:radical SAM/Cys-rich protein